MWLWIAKVILRNRIALLVVLGILTLFMGYEAMQVKLSYEFARVLPANDPNYIAYEQFKQTFGEDGSVMVLGFDEQDVFTPAIFNDWVDLSNQIKQLDGIEEVVSVGRIFHVIKNDSLQRFDFKPVFTRKPTTQGQLDSLRDRIAGLPFYEGLLFNKHSHFTMMAVTFDKTKLNTKSRIEIVGQIKNAANAFGSKHHLNIHTSGLPYIRTAITAKIASELGLFMLLAVGVTALILLLFFRSANAVIFSMLVVLVGVIWSLGIIVLLGYHITILTGLIPPLIVVIGVPNCIFLLNKYQNEFVTHGNKIKALSRSIEKIGVTTFLANVTTSIGFAVFYFTNSNLLMEFGLVAAIDVMATYVISLILIPIIFSYLPVPSIKHTAHLKSERLSRFLEKIDYLVHNKRKLIYVIVIITLGLSLYGISQIKAVGFVVDDLPKKDPIYVDMKFFEKNIDGVLPMEIAIDTKKRGGAIAVSTLYKLNRLERLLSSYPIFSKPVSIVDVVKFSYQAYRDGNPKYYVLPNIQELAKVAEYGQGSAEKGRSFKSFLDSTRQQTRVSVYMADIGSVKMHKLVNELKPRIDSIFPPKDYNVILTGNSLIFVKGNDYLQKNLIQSVLLAIVLIGIIMYLLFMSTRMIAISIIPSIIPLIITAGLMGYFGIVLKPSTILIFSIAFGISSDGTIYFLTKYKQELLFHRWSISKTVSMTIHETGVSMVYTAIILFCGFFIFTASGFGGTKALGILISFTLLVAMCSNLIILPCFLLSLERKIITKAFLQEPLIQIFNEEEDIDLASITIRKKEADSTKTID